MRVTLKGPDASEFRLDLPGATREDCDLLARWLAHILTPDGIRDGAPTPATFRLEVW